MIAKEITGVNDSDQAVRLFRKKLNSTESFFNDAPIPKNESDKEAHKKCSNLKDAEKYCPKRWAAMQLWFKEARRVSWSVITLENKQFHLIVCQVLHRILVCVYKTYHFNCQNIC